VAAVVATTTVAGAGVLQASSAEEAAQWRTTRFISQTLAEKQLGSTGFVGADEVRKRGEVIGYNSLTGRFFPARNRIVVRVGIALKGGVIMGRLAAEDVQEDEAIVLRGPILGGSGRYDGIRGRIVARIPAGDTEGRAHVTLRWRT
jgi:hypothetical protein